jgi:hypothetical protein
MTSRIFCDVCHCEIAISHFALHEATKRHKKNEVKAANNAGISCNSSSLLRKKQRNDSSVSYYQKKLLSVSTTFCFNISAITDSRSRQHYW